VIALGIKYQVIDAPANIGKLNGAHQVQWRMQIARIEGLAVGRAACRQDQERLGRMLQIRQGFRTGDHFNTAAPSQPGSVFLTGALHCLLPHCQCGPWLRA
jgi:hypothetical protein